MDPINEKRPPPNILIVDDTPANLQLLVGMLKSSGYIPRPVPNGRLALQAAKNQPPDLILLDINMPEMNGYEVCQRLKADDKLKDIPVLFISALTDTADKIKAFSTGGIDYVTKPFQFEEVHARVETHLRLHQLRRELAQHNLQLQELVQAQVKEISDSQMATIFALSKLAESRDDNTGRHLERVQSLSGLLAVRLAQSATYRDVITPAFINNICRASPMHDIGKVGIPDGVLLKQGRLTADEFEIMKRHSLIGASTLESVRQQYPKNTFLEMGIAIARSHHEWWDGSGYPDGLAGEAIPLPARLVALVDVYDALRSRRPYKEPFSHEKAVEIIVGESGRHFDPFLIGIFQDESIRIRDTWDGLRD
jgi:putative two-component system response regulator